MSVRRTESLQPPNDLDLLSDAALWLADLPADHDLFSATAQQLATWEPDAITVASAYEEESGCVVVRAMAGPDDMQELLRAHFPGLLGLELPMSEEARGAMSEGTLSPVPDGLCALAFHALPEELCRGAERALGLRSVWAQRLARSGGFLGTAALLSRRADLHRPALLEAFVRLAGVAIQRQATEAQLRASEARFRELAEQLAEVDQRRTEFLAVLSHELRNPLTPIKNSVFVIERAEPGSDLSRRAFAIIDRQLEHMTRLIDDLLDVTRVSRGKITLQRAPVDLTALARHTVEDHRSMFEEKGVAVSVDPASSAAWVNGDTTRLAQVLGNLLGNAVKFTPRGGRTVVSVEEDRGAGQAILRVQDTGAGVDEQLLPRLFQPFTQADTTLARSQGGLGLGLALVRGLIQMHGGEVTATSRGPGQGTLVTVRLPLLERRERPVVRTAGEAAVIPRRVLVIEDNVDAAAILRDALGLLGHEVTVATNGVEGVTEARRLKPEVVLCDIGLPGMDGYAVARMLRADPEVGSAALVAVTGYAAPEDVTRALEAGFDAHVKKPPDMTSLARVLADIGRG